MNKIEIPLSKTKIRLAIVGSLLFVLLGGYLFLTAANPPVLTTWGQDERPKDLGIGFIVSTNPYQFEDGSHYTEIYADKDLKIKYNKSAIFPFFYKPDYGLYHFICIEKTKDYFHVLINDSITAYLPNNANFYFTTWDAILLNSTVERLTNDNPIRVHFNNLSQEIIYDCDFDRLRVKDIIEIENEYWIYVAFSPTCEDYLEDTSEVKYGWVKWRTKNQLLVDILLLC